MAGPGRSQPCTVHAEGRLSLDKGRAKPAEILAQALHPDAEPVPAAEVPGDAVASDESGDPPAQRLLDDRPPGHQNELS